MKTHTQQLYAVSKLVGYCEAIAASGLVGDVMEEKLRTHIAETISAFSMQHHDPLERNLDVIRPIMETM